MRLLEARLWPVAVFTGVYLGVALVGVLLAGNLEFLFYIAVMLVLVAAIWLVDRRVVLSGGVLWALSMWGLAHMAGGLFVPPDSWPINEGSRVLYSVWIIEDRLKYDQVVHAYGFGVTTWLCWQCLRAGLVARGASATASPGLMVLVAAAGMGFGALNEVVEFTATLLVPETNVGGYQNTGWDLVANFVGVVVAALLIWAREGRAPATGLHNP